MYADISARIGLVAKTTWIMVDKSFGYDHVQELLSSELVMQRVSSQRSSRLQVRFGFEDTVKHFFSQNDKNHSGDKPCPSNNIPTSFLSIIVDFLIWSIVDQLISRRGRC